MRRFPVCLLFATACFPSAQPSVAPYDMAAAMQAEGNAAVERQLAVGNSLGLKDEKPGSRDAAGRPAFDSSKIRHPRDTPFHCFSLVDGDGNEAGECHEIKEWCVTALRKAKDAELVVTSGCQPVDVVSCYVAYTTGAVMNSASAFCWETPADCERMNERSSYQMGQQNVSECESLDRMFEPTA